jgi:hypothetical protein
VNEQEREVFKEELEKHDLDHTILTVLEAMCTCGDLPIHKNQKQVRLDLNKAWAQKQNSQHRLTFHRLKVIASYSSPSSISYLLPHLAPLLCLL